ncbi:MAG: carbohydrate kinase family protein [Bacteroidia bacterium]
MSHITVIGGIIMDIKAHPQSLLRLYSSNPARLTYSAGGVGRNIAENLARLGAPVVLLGAVGEDEWGKKLLDECTSAGIDTHLIRKVSDAATSVDISFMDNAGDLYISCTEMDISSKVDLNYLQSCADILGGSSYLVADTNIPIESLQYLVSFSRAHHIPLVIDPVSYEMTGKVARLHGDIYLITPNQMEWEIFRELNGTPTIQEVVVTAGAEGIRWFSGGDHEAGQSYPAFPARVTDSVGAGDALVSGLVYGLFNGKTLYEAIHWGMAAAALTLETDATVNPAMSPEAIMQVLRERS